LHFYDPQSKIQLRLDCHARLETGSLLTEQAWAEARPMSRACYAQRLAPGASIEQAGDGATSVLNETQAQQNFAVIAARIQSLDWLYLASQGHRRAYFDWRASDEKPTQTWLAP
jgi:hypothetical protein